MRVDYLIPLAGYFLGAIPFGFILVKLTTGSDIRKAGSGNIGATNVFRKSKWIGILTLLLDGGKGYLAVMLAYWIGGSLEWEVAAAVAAVAGHIFTVFLGFKGGKGVATGCGAYLALSPMAVGTTLVVFVLTAAFTGYVSLASILATGTFPLWAYIYHQPSPIIFGAIAGSLLIIARHHQNIRRLISGTESKFAHGNRSG